MFGYGSKINPATGRPHRDDKAIGADRKGRKQAKAELEAWSAEQKKIAARRERSAAQIRAQRRNSHLN
jgi:hypothetical protein